MNTPAPKTRREQAEEAAKKYAYDGDLDWNDPETAAAVGTAEQAYLQGWTDADSTPSEQGDEEAADENLVPEAHKEYWKHGYRVARRTQAAEIKKFRESLEDMVDCVPGTEMYFAARDLAKIVLEDYAKLTSNAAQGERDDKQAD